MSASYNKFIANWRLNLKVFRLCFFGAFLLLNYRCVPKSVLLNTVKVQLKSFYFCFTCQSSHFHKHLIPFK